MYPATPGRDMVSHACPGYTRPLLVGMVPAFCLLVFWICPCVLLCVILIFVGMEGSSRAMKLPFPLIWIWGDHLV